MITVALRKIHILTYEIISSLQLTNPITNSEGVITIHYVSSPRKENSLRSPEKSESFDDHDEIMTNRPNTENGLSKDKLIIPQAFMLFQKKLELGEDIDGIPSNRSNLDIDQNVYRLVAPQASAAISELSDSSEDNFEDLTEKPIQNIEKKQGEIEFLDPGAESYKD